MSRFLKYFLMTITAIAMLTACGSGDGGKKTSTPGVKDSNTAPIASVQSVTLTEDTSKNIILTGNDADGDSLTYTIADNPAHGTLSGTVPNVTYTPAADYYGNDSFTFKVNDGTADSATATVKITVKGVNDTPLANERNITIAKNTAKTIVLSGSDVDGDSLSFTIMDSPAYGTLNGTAPHVIYTPMADYIGNDSFTFKVNDGTIDSATATVNIRVSILKKTGQTISYNEHGDEVTDGSSKDDGYYQKGVDFNYTRDDAKEIVTDHVTKLMWEDDAEVETTKHWLTDDNYNTCTSDKSTSACYDTSGDTAATYCTDLALGDYTDWRLPTDKELEGILNYGKANPAIDTIFHYVAAKHYWSTTTHEDHKHMAWSVDFYVGYVVKHAKNDDNYVRCVRGGK